MKMMWRIVMCVAAAALLSLPVLAQEGKPAEGSAPRGAEQGGQGMRRPPMSAEDRIKRLTEELTLTKEQQDKVLPILKDEQKQREELMAGGGPPDRDKMMKLRTETNDKIKAVLNDDQKKKFDEANSRMRGPGGRGPGGEGKPPSGEKPPQ